MNVIVDTCIWSKALRRQSGANTPLVEKLTDLVNESRIVLIGAIRQEVLSGIKHDAQFERLRQALAPFEDIALNQADYELAAQFYNQLRAKGVQGSNTDFLICATAINYNLAIFTEDKDFDYFGQHLPLKLYV
uniref:Ribonuclease VapC n=1 Tax=uncultured Thiotrichaceae bacterium TaxID=298394 RepID=A0A6S6RYJ9_9GAMM|nr:MAG: Ribonuclease VapC [uncultured Thiotrichaceae bacterium]